MKIENKIWNWLGPGLIFASSAIGTSHLILSTRAGAHHGLIFIPIIILAMILKYPFYEFGARYSSATGYSILNGYQKQGSWALYLFLIVITIGMFTVVAAISAVIASILATIFNWSFIPIPILSGLIILATTLILIIGGFKSLDRIVKFISVVLLFTICITFILVLQKGEVTQKADFIPPSIFEGAGLTLLISLLGWMPAGMEASIMQSIWTVEKMQTTNHQPTLKESLFDFRIGYIFTLLLSIIFLTIGALTAYGSGQTLDGNANQFTNKLFLILSSNVGQWSYFIFAICALITIYGTLITVMDAFPRCFIYGLRALRFKEINKDQNQIKFIQSLYKPMVFTVGLGGFLLFYFSSTSMIRLLELVTVLAFVTSPILGYLNLKAIKGKEVPQTHQISNWLETTSVVGLLSMVLFSIFYAIKIL